MALGGEQVPPARPGSSLPQRCRPGLSGSCPATSRVWLPATARRGPCGPGLGIKGTVRLWASALGREGVPVTPAHPRVSPCPGLSSLLEVVRAEGPAAEDGARAPSRPRLAS